MELMQEKGYSEHREEEEEESQEEEEELLAETSHKESSIKQQHYPFSSSSNSPSTSNLWLGMLHPHPHHQSPEATTTPTSESHNSSSSSSFLGLHHQEYAPNSSNPNRRIDLMDLSLGHKNDVVVEEAGNSPATDNSSANDPIQKEHMFDKVVTPSDVGKLNRLVIPKQHAERFFPLDSSTNDKGLLLNFEDRTGKLWRFRYSYWNSSQSYVMTKGWSRFVKEKKLDAGDVVSFQRGIGELYRHRLYIDWRRRPDHPANANASIGFDHHLHHHHHHHHSAAGLITPLLLPTSSQYSVRWGGRFYSLPPAPAAQVNYHNYPFQQRQNHLYGGSHGSYNNNNELNLGSGSLYCYRPPALGDRSLRGGGSNVAPMIIDSVPVAHGKSVSGDSRGGKKNDSAGKRLRLFGVNMECSSSSSSLPSPNNVQYLRESHEEEEEEDPNTVRLGDQKGETSVLFDLNPSSFQHRQ